MPCASSILRDAALAPVWPTRRAAFSRPWAVVRHRLRCARHPGHGTTLAQGPENSDLWENAVQPVINPSDRLLERVFHSVGFGGRSRSLDNNSHPAFQRRVIKVLLHAIAQAPHPLALASWGAGRVDFGANWAGVLARFAG